MVNKYKNTIFDITENLFIKSDTDGLYVMPWRLLHDGYEVTRQDTVVRVDPDAGLPVTHSRFTVGGRIISAKIYVDDEPTFWFWYKKATNSGALPCWIYDVKLNGFMRCTFSDVPTLSPAGNSVNGMYCQMKFYAWSSSIPIISFITENLPQRYVTSEGNYLIEDSEEVEY